MWKISRDDLGLSGPVVAAFDSYWPAKSQVIFGMSVMWWSHGSEQRKDVEYPINFRNVCF